MLKRNARIVNCPNSYKKAFGSSQILVHIVLKLKRNLFLQQGNGGSSCHNSFYCFYLAYRSFKNSIVPFAGNGILDGLVVVKQTHGKLFYSIHPESVN